MFVWPKLTKIEICFHPLMQLVLVAVSYYVISSTLMTKTWISGKSWRPINCPSANMKFESRLHSAVSVVDLRRNSTLRNNSLQSWCHWSYWSVLMTMSAVSGDEAHLARCNMLRASPDATWHRLRASICDVSPQRLPWSSMCCACQWPVKHNF